MTAVAILHAYSAANAGDGLLVDAAIDLLDGIDPETEYTVFARYPESFTPRDRVRFLSTRWTSRSGLSGLRSLGRLDDFDLVVGVGGGYLRFGGVVETLKTSIAHLPQLVAAARTTTPAAYLPQSIGPEGRVLRRVLRSLLAEIDLVCLRDDRSVRELRLPNAVRMPDMALLDPDWATRTAPLRVRTPVLSVRPVRRAGWTRILELAAVLRPFDGWVQSRGAGNDDDRAVGATCPERVLDREEYVNGPRRVVVAVRLHAALMALRAGHWVVHLAYERKGFGAFDDLGLSDHVHSVYAFDPTAVDEQIRQLVADPERRARYDAAVSVALRAFEGHRTALSDRLAELAGARTTARTE